MSLDNPSFELPYTERGAPEVKVAHSWEPFWSTGAPPYETSQGPCARPEYKPITEYPYRIHSGAACQCWFVFSRVMDAGLYQPVGVTLGATYRFSLWAHSWCSNSDDPNVSDGEMYMSLGINPWGKTDPFSIDTVWAGWQPLTGTYELYETPAVMAENREITVFVRAWNKWRLKHNDIYVDDAELALVDGTTPPPSADIDYDRIRRIVREEIDRTRLSS